MAAKKVFSFGQGGCPSRGLFSSFSQGFLSGSLGPNLLGQRFGELVVGVVAVCGGPVCGMLSQPQHVERPSNHSKNLLVGLICGTFGGEGCDQPPWTHSLSRDCQEHLHCGHTSRSHACTWGYLFFVLGGGVGGERKRSLQNAQTPPKPRKQKS